MIERDAAILELWREQVTAMLASLLHDAGRDADAAVLQRTQRAAEQKPAWKVER